MSGAFGGGRPRSSTRATMPQTRRAVLQQQAPGNDPVSTRTKIAWGLGFVLLTLFLLWVLRPVFAILAATAGLAYVLDPVVDWLERRHIRRDKAIGLLYLGALGGSVLTLLVLVPLFAEQGETLADSATDFVADLDQHVRPALALVERYSGQSINLEVASLQQQLPALAAEYWPLVQERAWTALKGLFTQGLGLVSALVNLFLLPIFLFYLLRDWDRLVAAVDQQVPSRYRPRVRRIAVEVDQRLSAFVRGQLTVAALLGLMYAIGLLIVGIDLAIPVGLLSGALFIVPYLGNAIGFVLAAFLALVKFGFGGKLLGVAIVFVGVQLIEGNLLTPRIVGDQVGLHPLVVMIALIVGGSLLGIWGMLLAIPITAVLSVLANEWMELYRATALYQGPAPDVAEN